VVAKAAQQDLKRLGRVVIVFEKVRLVVEAWDEGRIACSYHAVMIQLKLPMAMATWRRRCARQAIDS